MAPDPGNQDLVLVASDTVIALINVSTKAIVEQKALAGGETISFFSKAGRPHIFTAQSGVISLYYAKAAGAIGVESLAQSSLVGIKQSFMDGDGVSITMLYSQGYRAQSVIKMRLSDALVMAEKTVDTSGDTSINGSLVFVNYKDTLGAMEIHSLDTAEVKRLEGYNFDYLRTHN